MARKSSIEKNKNREKLVAMHAAKRMRLKAMIKDKELPIEEHVLSLRRFSGSCNLYDQQRGALCGTSARSGRRGARSNM